MHDSLARRTGLGSRHALYEGVIDNRALSEVCFSSGCKIWGRGPEMRHCLLQGCCMDPLLKGHSSGRRSL
jgi:hypothetical protein